MQAQRPRWDLQPAIRVRSAQRATENNTTGLVDRPMDANAKAKPRMPSIQKLTKASPVGVLKPRCTTRVDRIRVLTGNRRIGRTSTGCRYSRRPNPGRGSHLESPGNCSNKPSHLCRRSTRPRRNPYATTRRPLFGRHLRCLRLPIFPNGQKRAGHNEQAVEEVASDEGDVSFRGTLGGAAVGPTVAAGNLHLVVAVPSEPDGVAVADAM